MNKIDELIQQYCPDGVEYVKLNELGSFYSGLSGKSKEDFRDGNAKFITYVNIFNNPAFNTDVEDKVKIAEGEKQNTIQYGDLLFTGSSETPDECGMCSVLTHHTDEHLYLNSFCFGFRFNDLSDKNPDFMKHLFRSSSIRKDICKTANGVTRYNISKKEFAKIEIPLPPLPVQEAIVKILDRFTVYAAELQAELQARQQQYNYYRDTLLSFEGREDVQWKKLGEVASIKTGRRFVRTDIRESGVPCFHYGDIYTYYGLTATKTKGYLDAELASKLRFAQPNDVVVVCAGENDMDIGVGVAWLGDEPAVIHDACCILHHEQNPRYISHFLRTHNYHLQMKRYVKNGKISSLPASGLAEALIPIPSLEEQEKIANILDRFDTLVNDLSQGLPAEIEARQQQYEYYRDQLLTFKRKEA